MESIKQLITLRHQPYSVPNKLEVGNLKLTNLKSIASAFNNHIFNIGSRITNNIPTVDISFENFLNKSLCHIFFLSPVSTSEIEEEISNLHSSKSVWPFNIPNIKILDFLYLGHMLISLIAHFQQVKVLRRGKIAPQVALVT